MSSVCIPTWLVFALDGGSLRLYAALVEYGAREAPVQLSRSYLAAALHAGERSVYTWSRELEARGLIELERDGKNAITYRIVREAEYGQR